MSAATDWWTTAHRLAFGALAQPRCKPPLAAHAALAHAIETLELEAETPKAPADIYAGEDD